MLRITLNTTHTKNYLMNNIEYLQKVGSSQIIMSEDFEKLANNQNVRKTRQKYTVSHKKTLNPSSCLYGYFVKHAIPQTLCLISLVREN